MKKTYIYFLCFFLFIFAGCVNRQEPYPKDGTFYCEELKMEINFSKVEDTPNCAYLYDEDENANNLQILISMGGKSLTILSEKGFEDETTYLSGTYKWQDDKFYIDSTYSTVFENKTYVFIKRSSTD